MRPGLSLETEPLRKPSGAGEPTDSRATRRPEAPGCAQKRATSASNGPDLAHDGAAATEARPRLTDMDLVTLTDVRAAAENVKGRVVRTPLLAAPWAGDLWLKPESLQPTGAFK